MKVIHHSSNKTKERTIFYFQIIRYKIQKNVEGLAWRYSSNRTDPVRPKIINFVQERYGKRGRCVFETSVTMLAWRGRGSPQKHDPEQPVDDRKKFE
jgi:hypothetical protein